MTDRQPPIQNPDIRFLGALLGDVIRRHGGEPLFRRIEYIRAASVDRARGLASADAVDSGLGALTLDDTLAFVRSFGLFSMLANLAEDRQGVAAEREADVAHALTRLADEGIDQARARALLSHALVVPVLTAHPTEVRRKSVIDHRNRIGALMAMRDAGRTETPDGDLVEEAIARQIELLWQTRALRRERLYVADEIDTALAHLTDVFLPTLPMLYARWDRLLGGRTGAVSLTRTALHTMREAVEHARSACEAVPLRQSSGASGLVGVAVDQVAFKVEVVVDVGVDGSELL